MQMPKCGISGEHGISLVLGSIEVPTFLESVFGRTNHDLDASRGDLEFFSGQPLTGMDNTAVRPSYPLKVSPIPF